MSTPSPVTSRSQDARPDIKSVFSLVREDFRAVNELIPRRLTSDVEMVEEIGRYIVESGGKRLRPLLVLLTARTLGYPGHDHVKLAAVIEFLHTATLLHDDVIDRSDLRRGRATVNARWGNSPSVLVGDFLYSRAFQMMVELDSMEIMAILSDATNVIAEGEVMQLAHVGDADVDESRYMDVIRCKTAMLFQAASHTGAVLAQGGEAQVSALSRYGMRLGLAYQIVDDWLDYAGDTAVMGKNVGDDLAEGKVTLPLIHAMGNGRAQDRFEIRNAIERRSTERITDVVAAVRRSGALEYTREQAERQSREAARCLSALPPSTYRDALDALAAFTVSRLS